MRLGDGKIQVFITVYLIIEKLHINTQDTHREEKDHVTWKKNCDRVKVDYEL